jgi:hypothetical protein
MVKRLTRLKISEVSSVDRGAGEGVKVVLFKRDSAPKDQTALQKLLTAAELTIGKDGTISTDMVLKTNSAKTLPAEIKNGVEAAVEIFAKSTQEIMASDEADKETLLERSYGEFVEHIGGLGTDEDAPAIAAAVFEALGTEDQTMPMTDKEIETLKAQAKEAETLKAEITKRDEEIAKRDAELVLAKLSAEHKAHAEKLSGDARAKFLAMSAEERDAELKKALAKRDEDPIFKAMNDRIAKAESENAELKKRLDAEEDAKERVAFGKRAVEVYGQPEAFGETLRKAYKGDAAAQAEVEKQTLSLKRMAEAGATFKNFGKNGGDASTASAQIRAKAQELQKADTKLSYEKAYTQVLKDPENVDLAKRLRTEELQGLS